MNLSHNWCFPSPIIRQRIEERNDFIAELAQNNPTFAEIKRREDQRTVFLKELITKQENIWRLIADKSSTTYSDKHCIQFIWLSNYIRHYLFVLEPHLKFQSSDDFNQHTLNCQTCKSDLFNIEKSYESIEPVIHAESNKSLLAEFNKIGLDTSTEFVNFAAEMLPSLTIPLSDQEFLGEILNTDIGN